MNQLPNMIVGHFRYNPALACLPLRCREMRNFSHVLGARSSSTGTATDRSHFSDVSKTSLAPHLVSIRDASQLHTLHPGHPSKCHGQRAVDAGGLRSRNGSEDVAGPLLRPLRAACRPRRRGSGPPAHRWGRGCRGPLRGGPFAPRERPLSPSHRGRGCGCPRGSWPATGQEGLCADACGG